MRKAILFVITLGMSLAGFAQKKNVNSAVAALGQKEYDEAKTAIDQAVNDESTRNDAKAWFIRGEVYYALFANNIEKYKSAVPELEAAKSYYKAAQLDPNYNKDEMTNRLDFAARMFFNEGIKANNDKNYTLAYEHFSVPVTIGGLNEGKRFAGNKSFDTILVSARTNRAYAAYFNKEYDKALSDFLPLKSNPIVRDASMFLVLADIYEQQGKTDELKSVIEEGIKSFPDNKDLRNAELNMYIKSGKQDELLKKLEAAVAKDPSNAELQFNLGNSYNNLAFPKDATGKELPRPANFDDLVNKAEKAYTAAVNSDRQNKPEYLYNLGALYFNQATEFNKQMNATGTSKEETKKYEELKVKRDAMFDKALPHLERTYQSLSANASSLSSYDKSTYENVLVALRQIYALQNKAEKRDEMKRKLDEFKSK